MRHDHKARWGLSAGVALAVLALAGASARAAEPQPGVRADTPRPTEQQESATPPDQEEQAEESAEPRQPSAGWYRLGPLTGQMGPGWSPSIGAGAPGAGAPCGCAGETSGPLRGWAPQVSGVIIAPPRAFGAGLGAQGGFILAPLPGSDLGNWSPSTGIGPRAYGDIVGR